MERVDVLGVSISNLSKEELNSKILKVASQNDKEMFLNVNIHAMNIAYSNSWFKDMLNAAYVNFCDGDGVRLGARIVGSKIKEKITYNRWIWDLASFSEKHSLSWFMLGSKPGVIDKCNSILKEKYPKLNINGYHHGFVKDSHVNEQVVEKIKKNKPNILILGMGMPLQEKWLKENFDNLEFNVALTGGAVFDYISGKAKMTPNIFYQLKMEWFYRFLQEPKRLFNRYFIGNPLFLIRIFKSKFFNKS